MGEINWKDKCWVATVFLVNNDKQVLLTWNKNMQTWIPVGGHIDPGETPEDAVKREVQEETGFEFQLSSQPFKFQIDKVHHHNLHMNFVFMGKVQDYNKDISETDENEKLKWFSREDIINDKIMLETVRNHALSAIDHYSG